MSAPTWKRAARVAALVLMAGAAGSSVSAQQTEARPADALFETLFPPELIMLHRRAIDLTDEQRDAISQLIQELQGRVVRLRWELLDDMQQLTNFLEGTRVDLDRSLDQLDAVLDTEREIKQAHLEMLVRIKNLLTAEQQETLERLRN